MAFPNLEWALCVVPFLDGPATGGDDGPATGGDDSSGCPSDSESDTAGKFAPGSSQGKSQSECEYACSRWQYKTEYAIGFWQGRQYRADWDESGWSTPGLWQDRADWDSSGWNTPGRLALAFQNQRWMEEVVKLEPYMVFCWCPAYYV